MENEICLICDLISRALDFIKSLSMSMATENAYVKSFDLISKSYEERGISLYNQALMDEMISRTESLYMTGEISSTERYTKLRSVEILEELHDTGDIHWHIYTKKDETMIPRCFAEHVDNFMLTQNCCDAEWKHIKSVLSDFCRFLSEYRISDFSGIRQETMRDYLASAYTTHTKSMGFVIYRVRSFLRYVTDSGVEIDPKVLLLLDRPARVERTVKPVIPQDDIARLLNSVDRSKAPGKRDYAILVLGVYTGLRAVDIANLKLSDVFWKERELRLTQHKTGKALTVPLEDRVVNAMADYVLHERPETDSDFVFLKTEAPFTQFARTNGIRAVFCRYLRKAGIEHVAGDGKTFHGLRRTLATGMLSEGVPVTTVSQTLGHGNIESTKQYISVDMTGLRKCALSFGTIGGEKR